MEQWEVLPSRRTCWYCNERKGKELPVERFTRYPCCGYYICVDCRRNHRNFCGECLTTLPKGDKYAVHEYLRLLDEGKFRLSCEESTMHQLGRVYITGIHSFVDEIDLIPTYSSIELKQNGILAIMNPPDLQAGKMCLEKSAQTGYIPAMIDLGELYGLEGNSMEAEKWFQKSLCGNNKFSPVAFTRYGLFLERNGRHCKARQVFEASAKMGHSVGQYNYAKQLLDVKGRPWSWFLLPSDELTPAVNWLCEASKTGDIPSMLLLCETLLREAERSQNSLNINGKSPIPRCLQILKLAKDTEHVKCSKETMEKIESLIFQYKLKQKRCANCGQKKPPMECGRCHTMLYCDKDCQRQHHTDGHKFDCCSTDELFDFSSIRQSLLLDKPRDSLVWLSKNPLIVLLLVAIIFSAGFMVGRMTN